MGGDILKIKTLKAANIMGEVIGESVIHNSLKKIVLIKHPYVNCFGVLMPITVEEAVSLTINIIWK